MALKITLFILTLFSLEKCFAFPNGAPVGACLDMKPKHADFPPTVKNQAQFFINVRETNTPHEYKVQLSQERGRAFKGFLLKAINEGGSQRLGEFLPHEQAKDLACNEPAITHKNTEPKFDPEFTFRATQPGKLRFRATVVNEYIEYYTNIDSNVITIA